MRDLGSRLPCRICGADRTGQKKNPAQIAVCEDCYPDYIREYVKARTVPLYLGPDLKDLVDEAARLSGVSIAEYIRSLLKLELERVER